MLSLIAMNDPEGYEITHEVQSRRFYLSTVSYLVY